MNPESQPTFGSNRQHFQWLSLRLQGGPLRCAFELHNHLLLLNCPCFFSLDKRRRRPSAAAPPRMPQSALDKAKEHRINCIRLYISVASARSSIASSTSFDHCVLSLPHFFAASCLLASPSWCSTALKTKLSLPQSALNHGQDPSLAHSKSGRIMTSACIARCCFFMHDVWVDVIEQ